MVEGMVYNVTPYMDYHPGGEEELMKAAGIDGTELFDQVGTLQSVLLECCSCLSTVDGTVGTIEVQFAINGIDIFYW